MYDPLQDPENEPLRAEPKTWTPEPKLQPLLTQNTFNSKNCQTPWTLPPAP
jgi:hypothetical protein